MATVDATGHITDVGVLTGNAAASAYATVEGIHTASSGQASSSTFDVLRTFGPPEAIQHDPDSAQSTDGTTMVMDHWSYWTRGISFLIGHAAGSTSGTVLIISVLVPIR